MAAPPPPPLPQGYDDKQVCYAEQHDLDMSKSSVGLHSDAPVPISGPIPASAAAAAAAATAASAASPWPNNYQQQQQQQQQQQYSPPPPSSAIPNYPTDQHGAYPASVAPSTGWYSGSPPPPSAMYAPTHDGFGPLPPPPPPPHETAARGGGGGGKDGLRILGLRPATFFLSIALVLVIVVAAVGGGVGGSMAVENAKRAAAASALSGSGTPSAVVASTVTTTVSVRATGGGASAAEATPTTTPTPTPNRTAKIAVPPTQGIIDFDCTKVQPTLNINLDKRFSFETLCGQDLVGAGIDILGIIVYNHAHCAQACASYNRNLGRNECVAVSFQADLAVLSNFGNCFLKNSTGSVDRKSNTQISYKLKLDG